MRRCEECLLDATHGMRYHATHRRWSAYDWQHTHYRAARRQAETRWCRWHATVAAQLRTNGRKEALCGMPSPRSCSL